MKFETLATAVMWRVNQGVNRSHLFSSLLPSLPFCLFKQIFENTDKKDAKAKHEVVLHPPLAFCVLILQRTSLGWTDSKEKCPGGEVFIVL